MNNFAVKAKMHMKLQKNFKELKVNCLWYEKNWDKQKLVLSKDVSVMKKAFARKKEFLPNVMNRWLEPNLKLCLWKNKKPLWLRN